MLSHLLINISISGIVQYLFQRKKKFTENKQDAWMGGGGRGVEPKSYIMKTDKLVKNYQAKSLELAKTQRHKLTFPTSETKLQN